MHPLVIEAETEVAEIVRSMRTVAVVGIKGAHMADEPAHSIPAMMAAHGLDWSRADITFYSDSANDLPLLERVDRPIATNPDPRLRAVAQERGWRILDLFSDET